jgi:hypothetical protein
MKILLDCMAYQMGPIKYDDTKHMITLTVITLSGFYWTTKMKFHWSKFTLIELNQGNNYV